MSFGSETVMVVPLSTSLAIARSEAIKKQNCTNAKEQLADQQGAEGHKGIL